MEIDFLINPFSFLKPELIAHIFSFIEPEIFLQNCALVCKLWNNIIKNIVSWENICKKWFGDMPISSLENLQTISILPNKLWYQVYIQRYMASKNRCSFCHGVAVFTGPTLLFFSVLFTFSLTNSLIDLNNTIEGELTRTRGLKFCLDCYHEQTMTSEEVEEMLRASLSPKHYQELQDMDIILKPSWKSGEVRNNNNLMNQTLNK
jgi:hypothetical protein